MVLRNGVCPLHYIGLMVTCCGMAEKKMGKVGVIMRKMKVTDCEDGNSDIDC
jgi:hypothetical protein